MASRPKLRLPQSKSRGAAAGGITGTAIAVGMVAMGTIRTMAHLGLASTSVAVDTDITTIAVTGSHL